MKTKKQKTILIIKIISVFFVLLFITLFIFRDALLQKALIEITAKMERDYDSDFSVKKAQFNGFTGVEMEDILLVFKTPICHSSKQVVLHHPQTKRIPKANQKYLNTLLLQINRR